MLTTDLASPRTRLTKAPLNLPNAFRGYFQLIKRVLPERVDWREFLPVPICPVEGPRFYEPPTPAGGLETDSQDAPDVEREFNVRSGKKEPANASRPSLSTPLPAVPSRLSGRGAPFETRRGVMFEPPSAEPVPNAPGESAAKPIAMTPGADRARSSARLPTFAPIRQISAFGPFRDAETAPSFERFEQIEPNRTAKPNDRGTGANESATDEPRDYSRKKRERRRGKLNDGLTVVPNRELNGRLNDKLNASPVPPSFLKFETRRDPKTTDAKFRDVKSFDVFNGFNRTRDRLDVIPDANNDSNAAANSHETRRTILDANRGARVRTLSNTARRSPLPPFGTFDATVYANAPTSTLTRLSVAPPTTQARVQPDAPTTARRRVQTLERTSSQIVEPPDFAPNSRAVPISFAERSTTQTRLTQPFNVTARPVADETFVESGLFDKRADAGFDAVGTSARRLLPDAPSPFIIQRRDASNPQERYRREPNGQASTNDLENRCEEPRGDLFERPNDRQTDRDRALDAIQKLIKETKDAINAAAKAQERDVAIVPEWN